MSFSGKGFTVTGLNEIIAANQAIEREAQQTKMNILREAAVFFVTDARKNVHKITRKTEKSTKIDSVTAQMAIISSSFGAPWEEKREGTKDGTTHKFMSAAAQRTQQRYPVIIKKGYDSLLSRHKTR